MPEAPENLQVSDWDKSFVDLKWSPPPSDGGAVITNYIVGKEFIDEQTGEVSCKVASKNIKDNCLSLSQNLVPTLNWVIENQPIMSGILCCCSCRLFKIQAVKVYINFVSPLY